MKQHDETARNEMNFIALMTTYSPESFALVNDVVFYDDRTRKLFLALRDQYDRSKQTDIFAAAVSTGVGATFVADAYNISNLGTDPQEWEFIVKGAYLNREQNRIFQESQKITDGLERALFQKKEIEIALELIEANRPQASNTHQKLRERMHSDIAIIRTGIPCMDRWFGGWEAGNYVLQAARPSVGKTAFGVTQAWEMAKLGTRVDYHSYEMEDDVTLRRLIARLAQIEVKRLRFPKKLKPEEFESAMNAIDESESYPLRYFPSAALGIQSLTTEIHKTDARVVFVDYLGCIPPSFKGKKIEEISDITNRLRRCAKSSGKVIIALSQMSRDQVKEQREPVLSDLRDSGELEQDADFVFFLHEPNAAQNKASGENVVTVKLIGEKVRDGEVGYREMKFDKRYAHYYDAEELNPPPPFRHEPQPLNF